MLNFFSNKSKIKRKANNNLAQTNNAAVLQWPNAWLLWFSQCANVILISFELSAWMLAILTLCLAWQALLLKRKVANNQQVSPLLLGIFAIAGCIAIMISAKGLGVLSSMVQLLCFSYVLKAFELRKRSDFYQLWFLGVFVLASALIFKQHLAFALLSVVVFVINLAVLLQFFTGTVLSERLDENRVVSSKQLLENVTQTTNTTAKITTVKESIQVIKMVAILVSQSLILAVVLFLVFPRLAPFWQVPLAQSAKTGLSDTLQPGDIANLARSSELAFRADFSGNDIPNYSNLYWRAMTLENYNGRQWSRATRLREAPVKKLAVQASEQFNEELNAELNAESNPNKEFQALLDNFSNNASLNVINYQVIAEPSFQRYLFALAPANSSNNKLTALTDFTWQAKEPLSQSINYSMKSFLTAPLELELSDDSAEVNLAYPMQSNPQLEALAKQLREDYKSPEDRSQAVLNMISQQQFFYTLQPPLLNENSLDQFFFSTKAGFCEHYASAYTFLMRASGIPARMVTGYLGGEYNNKSANGEAAQGHLSIYQYDAHAWSEIWIKDKGWVRVDPTGAVDPQRVNSGLSTELLQQQSSLNSDFISLYHFKQLAWLNNLRLQFDALDYQWTRLVLGYSAKKQVDLLKKLFGEVVSWKLALIITGSLCVSFIFFIIIFKWRDRAHNNQQAISPWLRLYQQALTLLAKRGLIKEAGLTVNAFSKVVRQKHPRIAIHFTRLSQTFNQLNYQPHSVSEQQILEKKMLAQFNDFALAIKCVKPPKSQK